MRISYIDARINCRGTGGCGTSRCACQGRYLSRTPGENSHCRIQQDRYDYQGSTAGSENNSPNEHDSGELLARSTAIDDERASLRQGDSRACASRRHRSTSCGKRDGESPDVVRRALSAGVNTSPAAHRMMHERGFETPAYCDRLNALENEGLSVIAVGSESHLCGVIGISDALRDGAKDAIENLHAAGVKKVAMLTGDNERAAKLIANECGIDDTRAGLLPRRQLRIVEEMSKDGAVAMIGDGVNDAPAMAAAAVGVAMGAAGTDAAIETADVGADERRSFETCVAHTTLPPDAFDNQGEHSFRTRAETAFRSACIDGRRNALDGDSCRYGRIPSSSSGTV